jgi:predicted nucleotidyltransferase
MPKESRHADLPMACLRDLLRWTKAQKVPAVVVGAVAASLLGRPRTTQDVDLLVLLDENRWEEFIASGRAFGFDQRHADVIRFAREARILLLRHAPSQTDVDMILGMLEFEHELLKRAITCKAGNLKVPLPRPEDLIVLKAIAHRARDVADIEGILDTQPKLDLAAVRRDVAELAAMIEMPEIVDDLEALLDRHKSPQQKRRKQR